MSTPTKNQHFTFKWSYDDGNLKKAFGIIILWIESTHQWILTKLTYEQKDWCHLDREATESSNNIYELRILSSPIQEFFLNPNLKNRWPFVKSHTRQIKESFNSHTLLPEQTTRSCRAIIPFIFPFHSLKENSNCNPNRNQSWPTGWPYNLCVVLGGVR